MMIDYLIPYFDSNDYVYFLDVGQGDASLVISKYRSSVSLIDTGGLTNYSVSDNYISMLKYLGIKRINNLILTHGDFDHMGEANKILNTFVVDKVIFNCGDFDELEIELLNILKDKKIKYYSCVDELDIGNSKMKFLNNNIYDNENDNSNVIYAVLDGYNFLFMGDASTTTERDIIRNYNLPKIDVLKVGHHGSNTSSGKEFIKEIKPKYSIISVGKYNKYGHPSKSVLNTLNKSVVYRTDQDGSVMFKIKINKFKIETCNP